MTLYQNQYRVETTRLKGWDYASAGWYFVTICTREKQCIFGEMRKGLMMLSPIGEAARDCWVEIPWHFPHACLDEFVVMPNHMHGIVVMGNVPVETRHVASLQVSLEPQAHL